MALWCQSVEVYIKENATRLTTNTLQMLKQHKPIATNTCWHKCASVQELTRFTHRRICVKPMHAVVLTDTKWHGFDEHMSHGFHLHVFPLYHTISIFYIYKLSLGSILYLAVTCWNHCSMCHDTCSASIYCAYSYIQPRDLGQRFAAAVCWRKRYWSYWDVEKLKRTTTDDGWHRFQSSV